jgi:class 3 adenylate cyclase
MAIVLGFVISYVITAEINRQVGGEPSKIAKMASQVSEGDFDVYFFNAQKPRGIYASVQAIVNTLKEVVMITKVIAQGETSRKISPKSDKDELASSINEMVDFFQTQNHIKDSLNQLSEQLSGNQTVKDICNKSISFIARFTESAQGAIYWFQEDKQKLVLYGSFAFTERSRLSNEYTIGEGLIGQVALEQKPIMLKNVKLSEAMIETGLVQEKPLALYALPLLYEEKICGVMELANFGQYTEPQKFFLEHATKIIATYIHATEQNDEVKRLLAIAEEAKRIAQAKQEEVALANIQLQQQQEELRAQAEDLEQLNETLEDRIQEGLAEINQQKEEIEAHNENLRGTLSLLDYEKSKADELLKNILPEEIAHELKTKGKTDTHYYKLATVLFTDFEGFTKIASTLSPAELVAELNANFEVFDSIIEKYNLEKIKTIGDAYMCAGGLPTPNVTNPIDTVLAALEIQRFMNQKHADYTAQGKEYWRLRLGVNSGELIAGVIGKKKFAYDIWGDAVNSASRMESNGVVGKVNISQNTYEYVKDFFVCEYRGKLSVKGKGEMDMYFVHGILPALSQEAQGIEPNNLFYSKLQDFTREVVLHTNSIAA